MWKVKLFPPASATSLTHCTTAGQERSAVEYQLVGERVLGWEGPGVVVTYHLWVSDHHVAVHEHIRNSLVN